MAKEMGKHEAKEELLPAWPLARLRSQMDRLFDAVFEGPEGLLMPEQRIGVFLPRLDIEEDDKQIRVTAELPGLDEKDVQIYLDKGNLVIEGEKKHQQEEKRHGYHRLERAFGAFRRVIPLPNEVEQEKVNAEFKKGVLTVTLPRNPQLQAERKNIPIKS